MAWRDFSIGVNKDSSGSSSSISDSILQLKLADKHKRGLGVLNREPTGWSRPLRTAYLGRGLASRCS